MADADLTARLRVLVSDVTRRDASKLGADDDLVQALGLDSLEALRVLAHVEKRCGVRFPDADIHAIRTLRQLADAVERRRP